MFIGYTLAVLSILGSAKVAIALLVLGVPIIDTFWIIVRRLANRRSPFTPDRGHVHHRLLDLGLSHTLTVVLIYAITAALAALTFLLSGAGQVYAFLGVVVGSGIVLFLLTGRHSVQEDLEAEFLRRRRSERRPTARHARSARRSRPTRLTFAASRVVRPCTIRYYPTSTPLDQAVLASARDRPSAPDRSRGPMTEQIILATAIVLAALVVVFEAVETWRWRGSKNRPPSRFAVVRFVRGIPGGIFGVVTLRRWRNRRAKPDLTMPSDDVARPRLGPAAARGRSTFNPSGSWSRARGPSAERPRRPPSCRRSRSDRLARRGHASCATPWARRSSSSASSSCSPTCCRSRPIPMVAFCTPPARPPSPRWLHHPTASRVRRNGPGPSRTDASTHAGADGCSDADRANGSRLVDTGVRPRRLPRPPRRRPFRPPDRPAADPASHPASAATPEPAADGQANPEAHAGTHPAADASTLGPSPVVLGSQQRPASRARCIPASASGTRRASRSTTTTTALGIPAV